MTYTIFLSAQSELVVNTYVDSTQRAPAIARDAIGNYIIVWKSINQISSTSKGDIFFQRFNSSHQCIGGETIVNTFTNGEQDKPAVAMNGNGDFVVVWSSYTNRDSMYDIKARLFKNSIPLGNEFIVNSFIPNSQTNPRVDIDESGKFIIAWDSWYQDGDRKSVV